MNILNIKIGYFLAARQIKRANIWVTILIIFVMTATFINLVVVSGILIGLISGSSHDYRYHYSGDVFIEPKPEYKFISNTQTFVDVARSLDGVKSLSVRYLQPAQVEANYKKKVSSNQVTDNVKAVLAGINSVDEEATTQLSKFLIAGQYLSPDDENQVLIGSNLLKEYSGANLSASTLEGVDVGSKIRLIVNGVNQEVVVKGIIKVKISDISSRIFINESQFRRLTQQRLNDSGEIAISLNGDADPDKIKNDIVNSDISDSALIQSWEESQGQFFKDLSSTFNILANVIGAIGLAVASITIFIVIFINAISRRKFIGILKGIGISSSAIRYSYLFQSIFYAFVGSAFGLALLYGLLVPYFAQNPIDFPFSDGILEVTYLSTALRLLLLFISTLIAGFLPAQIIIKKNTLDSILGR